LMNTASGCVSIKGCRQKNSPIAGVGAWVGVSGMVTDGGMFISVGEGVIDGVTVGVAVCVPKILSHAFSKGLVTINPSTFRN